MISVRPAILGPALLVVGMFGESLAFTPNPNPVRLATEMKCLDDNPKDLGLTRRAALMITGISLLSSTPKNVYAVDDDGTRGGVALTPFNSLPFNYRGNEDGGLDASTLDEPSIPFKDFLERIDEVEFVEFLAPDGDAAYVTFKAKADEEKKKPIRVGQGFPVEQHDGWSSPAFVVKILQKRGIPYKFTVPGLAAYM